jgi:hypothetical protein
MSAVIDFGNKHVVRLAAIGNATFNRAVSMGYSRTSAVQFARQAKRDASEWESPAAVAMRIVHPRQSSATVGRTPDSAA